MYYRPLDTLTFESRERIDKGGFGAIDVVTIKELENQGPLIDKTPLSQNRDQMLKMYKEFQLVQNFNGHPHIAAYLYFMIDHDKSHLIMEYV